MSVSWIILHINLPNNRTVILFYFSLNSTTFLSLLWSFAHTEAHTKLVASSELWLALALATFPSFKW